MKRFTYTFKVTGNLPFPIDMLRYDGCHPHAEEDSNKIRGTFDPSAGKVELWVTTYGREKRWRPTDGRWASFGWHIVQINCRESL